MNRYVSPSSPCSVAQQVEHLRLDRHVERGDGLVADDEVGLEDQRPGDPDALALAARELVRVAPRVVRLEADQVHHPRDLAAALAGVAEAVDAQPLADAVADRRARVERRVRVLEDDLHPPPVGLEVGALEPGDVRRRRSGSCPTWGRSGAAAAARRSSCRSRTRRPARASRRAGCRSSTPSTAWTSATVRCRTPPLTGKCLTRLRTSTSGAADAAARHAARGSAVAGDRSAAPRPASAAVAPIRRGRASSGRRGRARTGSRDRVLVEARCRCPPRPGPGSAARSGSPSGRSIRFGTLPGMTASSSRTSPSDRDRPDQAPRVRVQRLAEQRRDVGLLDDLAGVHHRDPVAHLGDDAEVVGDQDDGRARSRRAGCASGRGSAPGSSRRARSSARRR